jgi:hypothetical protein
MPPDAVAVTESHVKTEETAGAQTTGCSLGGTGQGPQIFAKKPSRPPENVACQGLTRGKSADSVAPTA